MSDNEQIYYIEVKVEFKIKASSEMCAMASLKYKLNCDDDVSIYYGNSMKVIDVKEDPYNE